MIATDIHAAHMTVVAVIHPAMGRVVHHVVVLM
jgi:hypothetical protein